MFRTLKQCIGYQIIFVFRTYADDAFVAEIKYFRLYASSELETFPKKQKMLILKTAFILTCIRLILISFR